jgi:uncharacterized repeat protein (TIGR01451 family)
MTRRLAALLLVALLPATARSQVSVPPPAKALAPLLYVRLTGPAGTKVTLYPGTPANQRYEAPVVVGLRPGYCYRVQFSDLPGFPGLDLYPTLEVRGSLVLSGKLKAADHPAPVVLDDHDLQQIAAGAYITKIIYLEHPEKAVPVASTPDQPITWEARPGQDPMEIARENGRPVLILRVGQRTPTAEELLCGSVPETVAMPGAGPLGQPPAPPAIPWACFNVYDPIHGPRIPLEECLPDGGDVARPAAFGPGGRLEGVDPTDTVAEYVDKCGRRQIAVSNRICICVPRFAVVRAVVWPSGYNAPTLLVATELVLAREVLRTRLPPVEVLLPEQPILMVGRERPTEAVAREGVIEISQLIGPALIIGRQETREFVGIFCEKCPPKPCPLLLKKCADKSVAQIGDVVTITLDYKNPGGQPISDLAVVDSLTGRLEYVSGSQKTDRAALFTLEENEAGSVKLRWEIRGVLQPGESGRITFQVRVR